VANRVYEVAICPIAVPVGENQMQVLADPQCITVLGSVIKYEYKGNQEVVTIVNDREEMVYSCPAHMFLWARALSNSEGPLAEVIPIRAELQLVPTENEGAKA
jgi:hypothetical protein